ncbi:MAG: dienelactone hydrolase family protein [Methylococcaceae bacterium]|jgi:dienelactone hydrolase
MAIISNKVAYLDDDVLLEAYFAFDDSFTGRRPAILIHHTWVGRDSFVEEKARLLAEMGYFGFAVDLYGKGVLGASAAENALLMQPFLDNRVALQKRVLAAFKIVKTIPWVDEDKIAAIGFCFGGLCALDLARTGAALKAVVSFHGLLGAPNNLQDTQIQAKLLVLHGHDDPMVKPEQVLAFEQEMTAAGADWQVHSYGHTVHAFTNPSADNPQFGTVYNPVAARRSWLAMSNLLAEVFA